MQNAAFPVNYLTSIWTPVRAFLGRKQLSWPKILFVILFLNGLMMIPISLNYARTTVFSLDATFPTLLEMVDEEVVAALDQTETKNGTVTFKRSFDLQTEDGLVAGGLSESEASTALEAENVIVFEENRLILKEGDLPISEVPYTADVDWSSLTTPDEVREEISQQWYYANQTYIVATFSFIIAAILLVMNLFLIFGAAFFIFLASRSAYIEIDSYKESVNLILNAMGLPMLVAMVLGLILPDITTMMSAQTFGLVIIIVMIYYKTRFSEAYVEHVKSGAPRQKKPE